MSGFIGYQSDPDFLLPQRIGDLIPQDDLSWVVMEVTDKLDISIIINRYSFLGTNALHPRMLLKLIIYGIGTGNRSSRKIARLAAKDLGGMMLCGGQRPSWRTIARFIQAHQDQVHDLFLQVLQLCIALGMVNFGQSRSIYAGNCSGCSKQSQCTRAKTGNRTISRDQYEPLREQMKAKLQTDMGREIYSHRKELPEPVFGQVKQQQAFHQHLRRGLESGRNVTICTFKKRLHDTIIVTSHIMILGFYVRYMSSGNADQFMSITWRIHDY